MDIRCEIMKDGLWYIGASDSELRAYHHAAFTDNGIMYSTYLLQTAEGDFVVIGAMPHRFLDGWTRQLAAVTGVGSLTWAVLFGTDDDLDTANALLAMNPNISFIAGPSVLYRLRGCTDSSFNSVEIRGDRKLPLGDSVLEFHGNRLTYVFDAASGAVFTGSAFGALGAFDAIWTHDIAAEAYLRAARLGYDDLPGRGCEAVLTEAVEQITKWNAALICPSLGPVVDDKKERLLSKYIGSKEKRGWPVLAIAFDSGAFVPALTKKIREGVRDSGEVEIRLFDLAQNGRAAAAAGIAAADAVLFGVSDTMGEPSKAVWDVVTSLYPEDVSGKPASVYCSTGSAGRASKILRERLGQLSADTSDSGYEIQGKPGERELKNAYEYGYNFGCIMQKKPNSRKPKLMLCLVCGEVFDASLGSCPVCGVGLDQCVPADEEDVTYKITSDRRYVILGGGIAAVSAADAIRKRDDGGKITIISAEPHLPINRPQLTKNLFAVQAMDELLVHDRAWYDERDIAMRLGVRALSIDPKEKLVRTDDGNSVSYDKLIYALGAECFVPPIPGSEKEGVVTLRHVPDGEELLRLSEKAKTAVVIGGGVIGLEAAYELLRLGIKVTVLEAAPQLLGRQIDNKSAELVMQKMKALGVECLTGVSIAAIEGERSCSGVMLSSGEHFPAELVVVSCGIIPETALAAAAGIACGRAVTVNQRMETNLTDVYACGDCAEYEGVNYQLWSEAIAQGGVAGANAAGDRAIFSNTPLGLIIEAFHTSIFAIGDPGKAPGSSPKTVELDDGVTGKHETYWFRGRALDGAVLIGAPEKMERVRQAVTMRRRYENLVF